MASPKANPSRPNSRHRAGLIELPAKCALPVPDMPGGRMWSDDERLLWGSLWTGPQATQWDDSFIPSLAAYICHFTAVMSGEAPAWAAQEMRHLAEQLGLTPRGMLALGWVLADDGGGR